MFKICVTVIAYIISFVSPSNELEASANQGPEVIVQAEVTVPDGTSGFELTPKDRTFEKAVN